MRQLTSIVALNHEGAIGAGNALPWRVRSDLRFFRAQTLGHVVIMGRRTFDSLGGKGLPGRKNVIVTHGFSMVASAADCRLASSIEEALVQADKLSGKKREVFVVGGASMYAQFAPYVDRYLITEIEKTVPQADTFFSRDIIGNAADWKIEVLDEGKADGLHDEANFKMFELLARNALPIARLREDVASTTLMRRSRNRLGDIPLRLRAAG